MGALFGWAGQDVADKAYTKLEKEFVPFRWKVDKDHTEEFLWRYEKRLNDGKNLTPLTQETGDCTSFATAHAGRALTAVEICENHKDYRFVDWFPPYIYGVSRTAKDCGNGQLGRSDGSVGAWVVQAVKSHGILFVDDEGVPDYSGKLADNWGYRGVDKKFYDLASDNPVKSASKLESVEDVRRALLNKCPVIIGSDWGFRVKEIDGYLVYKRNGRWGHEMCFLGWQDKPFAGAWRGNSWYPLIDDSSASMNMRSLHGEPEGGAWCYAEDIEKEIRAGAEVYSLNRFEGDKVSSGRAFI